MHKLFYKTTNCGFELFFCGIISYITIYGCPTAYLNDCFARKITKRVQPVSNKHEFLVMIIKPEHIASSNNINSFFNKYSLRVRACVCACACVHVCDYVCVHVFLSVCVCLIIINVCIILCFIKQKETYVCSTCSLCVLVCLI